VSVGRTHAAMVIGCVVVTLPMLAMELVPT
jgi:hypothetical protein